MKALLKDASGRILPFVMAVDRPAAAIKHGEIPG